MFNERDRDFLIVDVREPEEFRDWKIQGSLNIPLGDRFASRVRLVANRSEIVTVCRTGLRSLYAVNELGEAGIRARSLNGGMVAWSNTYVSRAVTRSPNESSRVFQIRRLAKGCASYLVADGDECTVVDPSSRIDEYTRIADDEQLRITNVIDTHRHADHVSGSLMLASATGAVLHLSGLDGYKFETHRKVFDGTKVDINDHSEIVAIHTPGHTPGSMSLLLNGKFLLSGDTLLIDGVGRPDLHGSTEDAAKQLYDSCKKIFDQLEPDTVVLPAHLGQDADLVAAQSLTTTLSKVESKLDSRNFGDLGLINASVKDLPKPPNYETILRINTRPENIDPSLCELLEEGPNRCSLTGAKIGEDA